MKSLVTRSKNIWNRAWKKIREGKVGELSLIQIPADNVDQNEGLADVIKPDIDYFEVQINEMYLSADRKWLATYDPAVLVISEFIYNQEVEAEPCIIGRLNFDDVGFTPKAPLRMVFSNTRVAGLHPFRGGLISLKVVLWNVKREDYATELMKYVEKASAAILPCSFSKVAGFVMDGVETLLQSKDATPLMGFKKDFGSETKGGLKPGCFALINKPENELDQDELWVRNQQLHQGTSLEKSTHYQDADFVLFSIARTPERTDISLLPFYPLWERAVDEASSPVPENWTFARAVMAILNQEIKLSPDLTISHAKKLSKSYQKKLKERHKEAVAIGDLGPETKESVDFDQIRKESLDILKMK